MTKNKKNNKNLGGKPTAKPKHENPYKMPYATGVTYPKAKASHSPVVTGSEYIGKFVSDKTDWNQSSHSIQPADAELFGSLSNTARRYDRYVFEKLEFEWKPLNSIVTTPGTVTLVWDPNTSNAPPMDLASAANAQHMVSGSVYLSRKLSIPQSYLHGLRYTRQVPTPYDPNLYDVGRLCVGFDSVTAQSGGYIIAHYRIRFYDHQSPTYLVKGDNLSNITSNVALNNVGELKLRHIYDVTIPAEQSYKLNELRSDILMVDPLATLGGLLVTKGLDFSLPPGVYLVTLSVRVLPPPVTSPTWAPYKFVLGDTTGGNWNKDLITLGGIVPGLRSFPALASGDCEFTNDHVGTLTVASSILIQCRLMQWSGELNAGVFLRFEKLSVTFHLIQAFR